MQPQTKHTRILLLKTPFELSLCAINVLIEIIFINLRNLSNLSYEDKR